MAVNFDAVQRLYVAYFNRPGDPVGIQHWLGKLPSSTLATQAQLEEIAGGFSGSAEYANLYAGLTSAQIVNQLYLNLFGRPAESEGLLHWAQQLDDKKITFEKLALQLTYSAQGTDAIAIQNKLAAANAFTEALDTTDEITGYSGNESAEAARNWLKAVTDSPASLSNALSSVDSAVAYAVAISAGANTYTLTAGVDVQSANVFNSRPEYTPGGNDFVNTLQDEDELTGVGQNPTLNVTLGSVNDAAEAFINPILNNIQTINLAVTSGNEKGLGLEGATGTKAINVTRITQNQTDLLIDNIAESVDTLSVANATRGADVEFKFRDDAGVSLEDELDVTLTNVRLDKLSITRTGSLTDQHDTVNLTTAGPVTEVISFSLFGDNIALSDQQLNLTAGATTNTFTTITAGSVTRMELVANGETEIINMAMGSLETLNIEANEAVVIGELSDDTATTALNEIVITGSADVDLLRVQGETASTAGLSIDSSALDATGRVKAILTSAVSSDADTDITFGAGADELYTLGVTFAGDVDAGEGNNIISTASDGGPISYGNLAATASIVAGDGDNEIDAGDMLADGDSLGGQSDDGADSAATITLGDGDNTVAVGVMRSAVSWNDWNPLDNNSDDTYVMVGAKITAGNGDNDVSLNSMAENAEITLGGGQNTVTFEDFGFSGGTVMAADSEVARERTNIDVQTAPTDAFGAKVVLGNGGNTVTFNDLEASDDPAIDSILVGRGALLKTGTASTDVLNVNFINDIQVVANAVSDDTNALTNDFGALIQGFETVNLTALKAGTQGTDATVQVTKKNSASVTMDVKRIDSALNTINLVSEESVTNVTTSTQSDQEYDYDVAGNAVTFSLQNLRAGIDLNLTAQEATGIDQGSVTGSDAAGYSDNVAEDDYKADVFLTVDMENAVGSDDTVTIDIQGASGTFDLDLTVNQSSFPTGEDAARIAGNDYRVEDIVINGAAKSHTVYFNDFGTGNNNEASVTVNGTTAGTDIVLNELNANVVTVNGAGDVTFEMVNAAGTFYASDAASAETLKVTTGSGDDHVHVSAWSMVETGSFINLGIGQNTVGLSFVDAAISSDDATALNNLDTLDFRGSAERVELLDRFSSVTSDAEIDLTEFTGTVSELYLGDFDGLAATNNQNDLTIKGMSASTLIQSGEDLILDNDGTSELAGRLTVLGDTGLGVNNITIEAGVNHATRLGARPDDLGPWNPDRLAGSWNNGVFTLDDGFNAQDSKVKFNLGKGNANLDSLNVAASDDVEVYLSNNVAADAFDIGAINLYSHSDDADLYIRSNSGTQVDVGSISIQGLSDADLNIRNNISDTDITITSVTLTSKDDDANIYVNENSDSSIALGEVSITSISDDGSLGIVLNDVVTVTSGAVVIAASDAADVIIQGNADSDVTLASVKITAQTKSATFSISDNDAQNDSDLLDDMLIKVTGSTSITGAMNSLLEIRDNSDASVEEDLVIDFTGNVTLVAQDGSARFLVETNTDTTIDVRGVVSVTTTGEDSDFAELRIANNTDAGDDSSIRFYDTVTIKSNSDADSYLDIEDNDGATVRFAKLVTLDSSDNAIVEISDNDGSLIRVLGGLDIDAKDAITVDITDNSDDSLIEITTVSGTALSAVSSSDDVTFSIDANRNLDDSGRGVVIGAVVLDAGAGSDDLALFQILNNSDTDITIGNMTVTGGEAQFIIGSDNYESGIDIGNVTLTADSSDATFDVLDSGSNGEDASTVRINDVKISAFDDVSFEAIAISDDFGGPSGGLGTIEISDDISITAGTGVSDGDIYFRIDTVTGTKTIDLKAGSIGEVYGYLDNLPQLTSLTVSGQNAELYLEGTMGPKDTAQGTFTLDLTGMTGSFGSDAELVSYNPTGSDATSEAIDNGTYVVTTGATFDNDLRDVVIKIGEGDLVYNAQHSSFTGSINDLAYSDVNYGDDWFGEKGWFSLGTELDLDPESRVLTFSVPSVGLSDGESGSWSFDIVVNGISYDMTYSASDEASGSSFTHTWSEPVNVLGGPGSGGITISGLGNILTVTGSIDGTSFTANPTTAAKVSGSGVDAFNFGTNTVTKAGDVPNDGQGNVASEVFTFVGDDIGDVVIGGFRPNGVDGLTGGIDYLDFSAIADITQSSGLIYTIDSGDGYFDDLIIEFVNQDYGSIRLVGVGEYFTNANDLATSGSIIF